MNACLSTTGLMQRLQQLAWVFVLVFTAQQSAYATPAVVSVDHRVTVTFSAFQFDAKKGVYTTKVRIKNRSTASIYSPLRLTFDQAALKEFRLLNAQGEGKDGRPYFEFALPKGKLAAGGTSGSASVVFAPEKGQGRYEGDKREEKTKGKTSVKEREAKELHSSFVSTHHVTAGIDLAPLEPRAEPYALTAGSGKVKVRFSVALAGEAGRSTVVYLKRRGDRKSIAMNDQGKNGDLVARDGIHGVSILVDARKLKADSCLSYEAYINIGHSKVVSPPFRLCVSAFPVRVAASNTAHPVTLPKGGTAVADEVLVAARQNANSAAIRRLATSINARVVGSIPPLDLYQLRLPSPVSANRLLELVAQLKAHPEVETASVNAIGGYAYTPSDPEFPSQHGLTRIRAQDVWDAGATGSGVTVVVLDSGLDRTHPDFGTSPGNCQLAEDDCGGANTDATGHGTQVAGVIAAKTNNGLGVAGAAYGSKIHSIQVSPDAVVTDTEMLQGFTDTATYVSSHGAASVVNASISSLNPFGAWASVCAAIDSVVQNAGIARAVVVNAAGNDGVNGNSWPGRCNDVYTPSGSAPPHRPDLFITVANSISSTPVDPICANATALDQRCGGTTTNVAGTSNYGAWVDMAAPGMLIRTTAVGGGYASPTGTSFSAPMVSSAAAILRSCNVPLDQVESILRTSANVTVPFPDGSNAPRLDVYRALQQLNHVPGAVGLSSNTLNENIDTAGGVEVGTLTATDIDTCDSHTYSIVGGADMGVFSIGGIGNDRLRLTAGVLDFETKSSYAVIVRVTDFWGATFDQPLTVNVNNLNEAPNIVSQMFSINENSPNGALVGTVVASDPDAGDTKSFSITAGNTGNAFAIDPATGAISVNNNAGLNYETTPSFSLTIQVMDSGGLSASAIVTVNLNNVNEAPAIASQVFTINENSVNGMPLGTVLASDPDAGDTLSYSIIAGNTGGAFSINANTGALSVGNAAAVNFEAVPVFNLTVQVTDAGGLSTTAPITVNVNNVNEAPLIASQTLPAINENSPVSTPVGTVAASDPDAGDTLSYSITGGNTGNAFAISGTGAVSVNNSAALDFETTPVFNLTVRVTDSGGLFSEATVTINLNNLPEIIPNPILVFDHKEVGTNYLGEAVDRYRFTVSNWIAYPASMFVARPDLPPCGLNTSASRTWVDFYRASDNSRIYGFCALGTPANLNQIWFGMLPAGTAPPASVYITLTDRETGIVYTSNVVTVPFP